MDIFLGENVSGELSVCRQAFLGESVSLPGSPLVTGPQTVMPFRMQVRRW